MIPTAENLRIDAPRHSGSFAPLDAALDADPIRIAAGSAPGDPDQPVVVAWPCSLRASSREVSFPVDLGLTNSVRVTLVIVQISSGTLGVTLEWGNDGSNWTPYSGTLPSYSTPGYKTLVFPNIGFRFVRVRYTTNATLRQLVFNAVVLRYRK